MLVCRQPEKGEGTMKKGPVYARRRALAVIFLVLFGFGVWKAAGVGASYISDISTPNFACSTESVVAESGDTIWDLAVRHCNGDISYIVWLIIEIRGTASLNSGDVITFPKG